MAQRFPPAQGLQHLQRGAARATLCSMGLEQHRRAGARALGFAVITISDTRRGEDDKGGAFLVASVEAAGHRVAFRASVADDIDAIQRAVREAVQRDEVDLVLTTGGTGVAPRDVTPQALEPLFESTLPGFGELFRWLSYQQIGAAALLSRAVGGLIARRVVLALPGSPKALELAMREIVLCEAGHLVSQARSAG